MAWLPGRVQTFSYIKLGSCPNTRPACIALGFGL